MQVIGDRVIVKTEDQTVKELASGLVTIEHYHPNVIGTVVASACADVKPADVVIFPPSAGQELIWNREHYLVLDSDELLAVYEGEQV
jgi:co-chaperonin GroES (HSP10)